MSGCPAALLSTRNEVLNVERGGFEAKWRAHALVEGCSIRSTERLTGVHRDTLTKLVLSLGRACDRLMQEQIRHVRCPDLQLDELWCYVGKKRAHVRRTDDASKVGDFWTWYGIDRDSKLIPHFHVGKRTEDDAVEFTRELRHRIEGRVQISTDKLAAYRWAIHSAWGGDVDYGRIVKRYQVEPASFGRYSLSTSPWLSPAR